MVAVRYSWLTAHDQIHPVLATWLIFCVAVTFSLMTYWSSKQHSLISNIANVSDLVTVWMVLASILLFSKEVRLHFNAVEIACLLVSGTVLVWWRFTKQHAASNIMLQIVMTVAYLPTLFQLWYAQSNTESFGVWAVTWVGSCVALVPAIIDRDKLAVVYALRALLLISAIIGLMIRLELR
jgi:hypothetical protein